MHRHMTQFSKWFLRVLVYAWLFGVFYGAVYLAAELFIVASKSDTMLVIELAAYFAYIATPLTVGGMGYYKSKGLENSEKIKAGYDPNYDDRFEPAQPEEEEDQT